jgi:hypothetical protein
LPSIDPHAAEAQLRAFIAQNRGVPPYQWRLPYHVLIAIDAMPAGERATVAPAVLDLGRFVLAADYRSVSEQNEALSRVFRTLDMSCASEALVDFAREAMKGDETIAHTCVAAIARLGRDDAVAVAALRAIYREDARAMLRAWFDPPPPPPPPPPPKKELDVAQIAILVDKLRAFIAAHEDERPPKASMPEVELHDLALFGKRAVAAVPVLLELAEFTYAYSYQVDREGNNRYDGADLRALASVVRTLGAIGSDAERVVPLLRRHLEPNEKALREAPPLQFWSTIDKYDREEDLRFAMQELIDACRDALASFGH